MWKCFFNLDRLVIFLDRFYNYMKAWIEMMCQNLFYIIWYVAFFGVCSYNIRVVGHVQTPSLGTCLQNVLVRDHLPNKLACGRRSRNTYNWPGLFELLYEHILGLLIKFIWFKIDTKFESIGVHSKCNYVHQSTRQKYSKWFMDAVQLILHSE